MTPGPQGQDANGSVPLQLVAHLGYRWIVAHLRQRLLIVQDGLRAHRSKLVREYLDSTGGDLQTEFLPPNSPGLSPVEFHSMRPG